jgi:hypothetical protein
VEGFGVFGDRFDPFDYLFLDGVNWFYAGVGLLFGVGDVGVLEGGAVGGFGVLLEFVVEGLQFDGDVVEFLLVVWGVQFVGLFVFLGLRRHGTREMLS